MSGERPTGSTRRTASRRARAVASLACAAALGLSAASAQAATVKLRCAGRGPRNADSAGTVLCAGSPAKGRTIAGVVRDDAGRPVAAKVLVTYSAWTPAPGGGWYVKARATRELTAKGDGTFAVKVNPATRESLKLEVVADAALGVSGGAFAQAEVSRQLKITLAKLGGGSIRITVKGSRLRGFKAWVLSESGYALPGVKPKKLDGRGQATFNLGSMRGTFAYYVDTGIWDDLFWYRGRTRFRL